jgi:C1A family cysteine protease
MRDRSEAYPRALGLLALVIALLLALLLASSPAGAASAKLSAQPLSADFLKYQAEQRQRQALGLDGVPWSRLGLIPAPMDPPKAHGGALLEAETTYPASFDLRAAGKVSPVKDQDPYGACWTFATFASAESCLLPGELRDFSEDNMVLNSGFDANNDPYDYGGTYYKATAYLVRWSGPVDESDDAYGDSYTPPGLSAKKHVQEVLYVAGGASGSDTARIKAALTTYGAVATAMRWEAAYYKSSTASFYYNGSAVYNHAVTIVGWDDNYPAANFNSAPAGNGAWLVKNSWGTSWGQAGYFWVSYYDKYLGTDEVFNAVYNGVSAPSDYSTVYYYDTLGEVSLVGYRDPTAWGANVFKATSSAPITAVGFFTHEPGTTYTVYAGGSLGTLQAKGSGSFSTAGYHTVKFSSPLAVTSGSSFAVAMRLTVPGAEYPIAYERAAANYSSKATAAPGQSYLSRDGGDWGDLTEFDPTANVCLKAYSLGSAPPPGDDSEAPETSARGYDALWHKQPVRVSFSAVDRGDPASGVAYTEYSVNGGSWTKGTSVLVSTNGGSTISYRSADNAGNIEVARNCVVKVDTVGPVCTAKSASVKRGAVAKVYFKVADNVSPEIKFTAKIKTSSGTVKKSISSGTWVEANSWWRWTFSQSLAKGKYQICVYGTDRAGNAQRTIGKATLTVK